MKNHESSEDTRIFALEQRLAALEAAPRLTLVYEVEQSMLDNTGAWGSKSLGAYLTRTDAEERASKVVVDSFEDGKLVRDASVTPHLAVVIGDVVQVVQLGKLLTMASPKR